MRVLSWASADSKICAHQEGYWSTGQERNQAPIACPIRFALRQPRTDSISAARGLSPARCRHNEKERVRRSPHPLRRGGQSGRSIRKRRKQPEASNERVGASVDVTDARSPSATTSPLCMLLRLPIRLESGLCDLEPEWSYSDDVTGMRSCISAQCRVMHLHHMPRGLAHATVFYVVGPTAGEADPFERSLRTKGHATK